MKLIEDIINRNVNQVINEYADKYYLKPLFNYFNMSDEEKENNNIYQYINRFQYFLEVNEDDIYEHYDISEKEIEELKERSDECDDGLAKEIINGKYNFFKEDFVDYLKNYFWDFPEYEPSYNTMQDPKYVHNKWLVHFSDNAYNISYDGFAYGTYEKDNLAYTGCGDISNKYGEGYDFAFDAYNCDEHGTKYGKEAVLFQASGVELTHYGDRENQVVFWGPSAKNFIYITNTKGSDYEKDWTIFSLKTGKVLFTDDEIENVIDWAIRNFDQYQRQMVNYKANKRFRNYETNYNG